MTVPDHPLASSTYYMRQTPGLTNACGTIAMLHAILNNRGVLGVEGSQGILEKFYQATKALGAEERGGALHDSKEIGDLHNGWDDLFVVLNPKMRNVTLFEIQI